MSDMPSEKLPLVNGSGNWKCIASSSDLDIPRPVIPVALDGKQWVLFRDHQGELGLIGRHCPHRGADLCFARREPEGSTMYTQIKALTLPVVERDDNIYALLSEASCS